MEERARALGRSNVRYLKLIWPCYRSNDSCICKKVSEDEERIYMDTH